MIKPQPQLTAATSCNFITHSHKYPSPENKSSFYMGGTKKSEENLKNGKKDGVEKNWYDSGRKKSLKHFKDGIENGIRKEWDKNGLITYQENYVDGVEEIK